MSATAQFVNRLNLPMTLALATAVHFSRVAVRLGSRSWERKPRLCWGRRHRQRPWHGCNINSVPKLSNTAVAPRSLGGAPDRDGSFEDAVPGAHPAIGLGGAGLRIGDEQDGAETEATAADAGVGVV